MGRRKRRRRRGRPPRPPRESGPYVQPRRGPRPRGFKEWSNSPRVAGWFLTSMAALCGVFAVGSYYDAVRLRDHGVRTTATVLSVHDGGRTDWVVVRFTTGAGRERTADVYTYRWDPRPEVGDRPEVVYDPASPEDRIADVRVGPDFLFSWLIGGLGVVFGVLAWLSFRRSIDWNEWA